MEEINNFGTYAAENSNDRLNHLLVEGYNLLLMFI